MVYIKIFNPVASVINVENVHHLIKILAVSTLRNILGTKSLHETLQEKEKLSHQIQVR